MAAVKNCFDESFPSRVSEDAKHFALSWLGECLAANSGRGQMWTSQMGPLLAANYASDGFMLNLGSTLLRHTLLPSS
jgi:hypothetical protein